MWATRSAPPVILCLLRAWFDELIHGKRNYSILLIRTTQSVPTRVASTDWLWVIQVSDQIAVVQLVYANNEYYFTALLQRAFKTRMLRIPVKRRGRGEGEGGREEGEVGTRNRSYYQYPALRCDPVQYLGEMFCLVFQVFSSFLHFKTQKYLHVLFISI